MRKPKLVSLFAALLCAVSMLAGSHYDVHTDQLYAYQTKFAAANVTWVNDLIPETQMPLTFEAIEAGATVTYAITSGDLPTIKYSTDGITWTTYTDPITLANAGDKVYFYGHNSTYRRNGQSAKFQCSADCYLYGNIMSLVNEADFSTQTALGDYAFYGMFGSNTHIKNHPTLDIILPAATMHQYCYAYMFHGCTGHPCARSAFYEFGARLLQLYVRRLYRSDFHSRRSAARDHHE